MNPCYIIKSNKFWKHRPLSDGAAKAVKLRQFHDAGTMSSSRTRGSASKLEVSPRTQLSAAEMKAKYKENLMTEKKEPLYQVFRIPKRTGGVRVIEAPCDELKARQRATLARLVRLLKVSPFSHAFHYKRSIATMAEHHVGKPYVLAFDLSDFFPSVTAEMFLKHIGDHCGKIESDSAARLKNVRDILEDCFHDFQDGKGVRLPQGAPTSPLIANALLYRFDWRCAWHAYGKQVEYGRYADDLVFSGDDENEVWACYYAAKHLLEGYYGLKVNSRKVRMMRRTGRQMICGIVVNEKLHLRRRWRKNLRAALHQERLYNLGEQGVPEYAHAMPPKDHGLKLAGKRSFHHMVHEEPAHRKSSIEVCSRMDMIRQL